MERPALVHVISKRNNAEHFTVPAKATPSEPLAAGSVRMQPCMLGVTANTLTYAVMGGPPLYWWDAFTVPSDLKAPYNDHELYGIVPAWGFAEVVQSKVEDINTGMLIWGFWPTATIAVDLKLEAAGLKGHYVEISAQRKRLFNLYRRYIVHDTASAYDKMNKNEMEELAWRAVAFPVGEAGFMLNNFIFGHAHIHPADSDVWTTQDANLSKAIVISLGASGKTARSFNDGLICDRPSEAQPLGLLAVTANANHDLIPTASFETRVIRYEEVDSKDTLAWIEQLGPSRAVIVDFGSRGNALIGINEAMKSMLGRPNVAIIGVGSEPKIRSAEETAAHFKQRVQLDNRVQMNATMVRDAAMAKLGDQIFFEEVESWYDGYTKRGNLDKMRLEIGHRIDGTGGLSECWTKLCEQRLSPDVGMAFKLL